jgi:hypothetical protein
VKIGLDQKSPKLKDYGQITQRRRIFFLGTQIMDKLMALQEEYKKLFSGFPFLPIYPNTNLIYTTYKRSWWKFKDYEQ